MASLQASGRELNVLKEFYSNHDFHISALELFESEEIPLDLRSQLSSLLWKTEIPKNGQIVIFRDQVSSWLRDVFVKYNKGSADNIRLMIPSKVTVHSKTRRISTLNISLKIQEKAREYCGTCDFEVKITKALPRLPDFVPYRLESPEGRWKGHVELQIVAEEKIYPIVAHVRWFENVVTAKYQIPIGTTLTAKNTLIVRREVTFAKEAPIQDLSSVLGMKSAYNIRKGQSLVLSALKKPQVVRFGQVVSVALDGGRYSVTTVGKARGAGGVGDVIPVEVSSSKKRLMGEVINHKLVRVQ